VRIRIICIVAALGAVVMAACASKTADDPSSIRVENISRDALDAARVELEERIASKSIAGGAHMVVRNGEVVYFNVAGVRDIEDRTPLAADTIMRIYSMTKPITSVAAMMLWQRGVF
jgi:CubicO group peptidase (beta-lactamase class C family)